MTGPSSKSGICQRCRCYVLEVLARRQYQLCRECAYEWDWRASTTLLGSADDDAVLAGYVAEGGGL